MSFWNYVISDLQIDIEWVERLWVLGQAKRRPRAVRLLRLAKRRPKGRPVTSTNEAAEPSDSLSVIAYRLSFIGWSVRDEGFVS